MISSRSCRADSAVMFSGFRRQLAAKDDTVHLAAGATRELSFSLEAGGTEVELNLSAPTMAGGARG